MSCSTHRSTFSLLWYPASATSRLAQFFFYLLQLVQRRLHFLLVVGRLADMRRHHHVTVLLHHRLRVVALYEVPFRARHDP